MTTSQDSADAPAVDGTPLRRRIAIVGGGLSGLATATHLHQADPSLELSVYESTGRLGGVIQSEKIESFVVDHGADMFAGNPPHAIELCEQLGVTDQLIEPKTKGRGARIVYRGRLVPIPDGFVLMRATRMWPMLTTSLLSPSGKWRIVSERFQSNNVSEIDQSVADFVRHRMGENVLQRIVGPLVAGIYTADIEKLSLLATMGPIAKMVRTHGSLYKATLARKKAGDDSTERNSAGARYSQFRAFKQGMGGLTEALSKSIPTESIHLNHCVTSIQRDSKSNSWSIHSGGRSQAVDHVVLTTPARVTSRLIEDTAPVAAKNLSNIESASTAIVILGVRRSDIHRPVDTFGFVVPAVENRKILAGSFASNKFSGRAPDDHLLIRVFIGGALQSHLLDLDDEKLIQIARDELADLIGLSGEPVIEKVIRWNEAMPQYHVGHLQRVREIERNLDNVPGLSVVSNALHGVGISPIIGAAKQAAQRVRQSLLP